MGFLSFRLLDIWESENKVYTQTVNVKCIFSIAEW